VVLHEGVILVKSESHIKNYKQTRPKLVPKDAPTSAMVSLYAGRCVPFKFTWG